MIWKVERTTERAERLRRDVFETLDSAVKNGYPFRNWSDRETAVYLVGYCTSSIELAAIDEVVPHVRAWRALTK